MFISIIDKYREQSVVVRLLSPDYDHQGHSS